MFVWKDEDKWKRGREWPIKKQKNVLIKHFSSDKSLSAVDPFEQLRPRRCRD